MAVFLDTNLFLYAAGAQHPLRSPCQAVLKQLGRGALAGATSTEVVQELMYVLCRRGRQNDALRLARNVLALFPNLLPVTRADMALACNILEQAPGIPARDAVHAATMRNNGLEVIISADRHFDAIGGIRRIDPADAVA